MLAWRQWLGLYFAALEVKMEIMVIDGHRGGILLRGQLFQEFTSAYLTRATFGRCFCTLLRIYVGFRVEISAFDQRTAATPVDSNCHSSLSPQCD
jgi:hypothetical protein